MGRRVGEPSKCTHTTLILTGVHTHAHTQALRPPSAGRPHRVTSARRSAGAAPARLAARCCVGESGRREGVCACVCVRACGGSTIATSVLSQHHRTHCLCCAPPQVPRTHEVRGAGARPAWLRRHHQALHRALPIRGVREAARAPAQPVSHRLQHYTALRHLANQARAFAGLDKERTLRESESPLALGSSRPCPPCLLKPHLIRPLRSCTHTRAHTHTHTHAPHARAHTLPTCVHTRSCTRARAAG
jgi:hypothetical protein